VAPWNRMATPVSKSPAFKSGTGASDWSRFRSDAASTLMIDRCKHQIENPTAEGWDGTTVRMLGVPGPPKEFGSHRFAGFSLLPWDLVARISSRITNEVRGINRVVLDVSSKPPATIEWE